MVYREAYHPGSREAYHQGSREAYIPGYTHPGRLKERYNTLIYPPREAKREV